MSNILNVEKTLEEYGLTSTEARLYAAGLRLSPCTIPELAKETQIKRPTIYHAINTLSEKGLVNEKKNGTKTVFIMTNPEHINSLVETRRVHLDAQMKQLEILIPLLTASQQNLKRAFNVTHQHGVKGMKMVMDSAFRSKGRHWDIIAPYQNFLRSLGPEYSEQYLRTRKVRNITSRTLWENGFKGRKLTEEEQIERNPRYMPKTLQGKFTSMLILFDDKIAIFSSDEDLSAILIESKEIHAMFQAMFECLWEYSEPY